MIMNKSASKKLLLASAAALSLSALLFAGTTYAWFTDSASSATSTIQSGNLDVNLYQLQSAASSDSEKESFEYVPVTSDDALFGKVSNWEPGAVEVVYLKVANDGSLALKFNLSLPVFQNTIGKAVNGESIDLTSVLQVSVVEMDAYKEFDSRAAALEAAQTGRKVSLGDSGVYTGKLAAHTDSTLAVIVYMPETVGNEANHNGSDIPSFKAGVSVAAGQDTVENDSFGSDYDKNAIIPVSTSEDFAKAAKTVKGGDVIVLNGDIETTSDIIFYNSVTIKGDGDTTISGHPIFPKADITIEGVTFADQTYSSNMSSCVSVSTGAKKVEFKNCTFANPQWEMIQVSSETLEELIIDNCTFIADNIQADHGDLKVPSDCLNRFLDIRAEKPYVDNVKITITNNTFNNCDKTQLVVGLYYYDGELTIGNNVFNYPETALNSVNLLGIGAPAIQELNNIDLWTGEINTYSLLNIRS
jgi:predicted ribosomally synthesized peptide with SipW-like signal peptide